MLHDTIPPQPCLRLALGKVQITAAATAALKATETEGVFLLHRHLHGDWGDVTTQDALQNEIAMLLGMRVLSRYALTSEAEIWILTQADRAMTTIMAPGPMCTQDSN
jgi:hypothetical protein